MARYRFALAPKWVVGHVLVLAAAVTMVLLGRWQLHVSEHKGFSLQNFGYALQWWAFTCFAVLMWAKILRDVVRHRSGVNEPAAASPQPAPEAAGYRSYRPPQMADRAPAADDDPVMAQYNAYLAQLAEKDARR